MPADIHFNFRVTLLTEAMATVEAFCVVGRPTCRPHCLLNETDAGMGAGADNAPDSLSSKINGINSAATCKTRCGAIRDKCRLCCSGKFTDLPLGPRHAETKQSTRSHGRLLPAHRPYPYLLIQVTLKVNYGCHHLLQWHPPPLLEFPVLRTNVDLIITADTMCVIQASS